MSYEAWGEPDGRPFPSQPILLHHSIARCDPQHARCPQRSRCARAIAWNAVEVIDATVCLGAGWCPLFIDKRTNPRTMGLS